MRVAETGKVSREAKDIPAGYAARKGGRKACWFEPSLAFLFILCGLCHAGDTVALTQRGNSTTVSITVDCTTILSEHTRQINDNELGRISSLSRKTLTDVQIVAENKKYDDQAASIKRSTQLKFFDCAIKALQASQNRAALSDADAEAQVAAQKAKLDAEAVKADALKPTVDADIAK